MPKTKNSNLHKAKRVQNNEFYTRLTDIEQELRHYKEYFRGKTVFLNCDDPEKSNFWKHFEMDFQFLGLKKLVATHYETDKPSYKLELIGDVTGDGKVTSADIIRTPLQQNGDFRSPECVEILRECDVVVTNPPFSLAREYVELLVEEGKDFLILGNMNWITYKEIFRHIQDGKLWLGYKSMGSDMLFHVPESFADYLVANKKDGSGYRIIDGELMGRANGVWFTNLPVRKREEELILGRKYKGNEKMYPKYDNYDAINVDKVVDIPEDYMGAMGVPITYLDKHNPEQFDMISCNDLRLNERVPWKEHGLIKDAHSKVNGKNKYVRMVIRRKQSKGTQ